MKVFNPRIIVFSLLLLFCFITTTFADLPSQWQSQDIGSVNQAGSAEYVNGTFTISGSGSDIWDNQDQFHYAYQSFSGDVQVTARVVSQTNTDGWAKAGIMLRESLDNNSKHVMTIVSPSNGSSVQHRAETGGGSFHTTPGNGVSTPCWLKMVRLNNEFNGYSSLDGENWTLIYTASVSMSSDFHIGLCVTAHNGNAISTAVFDNVTIISDSTAPNPNPATWEVAPHATGSSTIEMSATEGTDDSGIVEYYFEETSGNLGGNSSGWISSRNYTDLGLKPLHTYTYKVRMRDLMGNTTEYSDSLSVTTGPIPDTNDDQFVNIKDFDNISNSWFQTDCSSQNWCDGADFDLNGVVDLIDLEIFSNSWLQSTGIGFFHEWAATPPMGWNSWDSFGCTVTEDEVKANADYMAQNLKQYGWEYVIVDIQWYEPKSDKNSSSPFSYPSVLDTNIDEFGRVWPAANKHPSSIDGNGFVPLSNYVHSLGLKFGVHMMRGIPKFAYERDTPVLGTNYTARDIANTSSTCPWNPDMYGVDMSKPGAQEYYNSIFDLVASWGVDYVKIDDLSRPYHTEEIEAIRKAIDQTGRKIVFSTSPGATPLTAGAHVSQHANLWRISDDFWDSWGHLDAQFQRLHDWSEWNADGHYPDADMLPLGNVRTRSNGWTNFTETEQKTMMDLWAIARSPLMMGGHMPNNDAYTLSMLTNAELLEVNQHSINNHCIRIGSFPLWMADVRNNSDEVYLAIFNRTNGTSSVQIQLNGIEIKNSSLGIKKCKIRDLWSHSDLGEFTDSFTTDLPGHGSAIYKVTILEKTPLVVPELQISVENLGFDSQVYADNSWSGAGDISGWNNDTGGWAHTQNLPSSAISPDAQSGENTCGLNQGAWIGQNIKYTDGSPFVIESGKSYKVSVWVGRRNDTAGSAAGILSVYLADAVTGSELDQIEYDLIEHNQGSWVKKTFNLSTGNSPAGIGNGLRLGFKNTGTRGSEHWHGQVVIDSVSFEEIE